MPSAAYALFRRAILDRKLIVCLYRGKRREIAPHILGFKNRIEKVLVFQFGGETNSKLPPGGEWRCFALKDVEDVTTMDGAWRSGGSHSVMQVCIDIVDVDVNIPATLR
jgi:hypothetical protein